MRTPDAPVLAQKKREAKGARWLAVMILVAFGLRAPPVAQAEPHPSSTLASPVLLDRVAARWHAPETGGPASPQFVFARELAFEARIESLADPDPEPGAYHDRHVRAALDRQIAETLLATLPVFPVPTVAALAQRAEAARQILEQRVHGRTKLLEAAIAEGIGGDEVDVLLRRQARASLYVDRMIAPMLEPSELELRDLLRAGTTPFKDEAFEKVGPALVRWYMGQRLSEAIEAFFQNARSRVVLSVARKATP